MIRFRWRDPYSRYIGKPPERSAEELTTHVVNQATVLIHGDLEMLRAEHECLLEIVGRLVARLPAEAVAEVLGLHPEDVEIVP